MTHHANIINLLVFFLITSCSTQRYTREEISTSTLQIDSTIHSRNWIRLADLTGSVTIVPDTSFIRSYSNVFNRIPSNAAETSNNTHNTENHNAESTLNKDMFSTDIFSQLTYQPEFIDLSSIISPNLSQLSGLSPSSGLSPFIPYKIIFDLHAKEQETELTETINKTRADSTIVTETDQLTTRDTKVSSWWLKFRFRAILSILLLSMPFTLLGFYRIYRRIKGA